MFPCNSFKQQTIKKNEVMQIPLLSCTDRENSGAPFMDPKLILGLHFGKHRLNDLSSPKSRCQTANVKLRCWMKFTIHFQLK